MVPLDHTGRTTATDLDQDDTDFRNVGRVDTESGLRAARPDPVATSPVEQPVENLPTGEKPPERTPLKWKDFMFVFWFSIYIQIFLAVEIATGVGGDWVALIGAIVIGLYIVLTIIRVLAGISKVRKS